MVELPAGPNGGRSNYDYYDTLEKGVPTHSGHLRGPLPLKITLFGATSCISLAWFCIPKALATWRGEGVVVPSWQWLFVVLICILTYWSQKATPPVWPWFFHRHHSPSIVLFLRLWAIASWSAVLYAIPPLLVTRLAYATISKPILPSREGFPPTITYGVIPLLGVPLGAWIYDRFTRTHIARVIAQMNEDSDAFILLRCAFHVLRYCVPSPPMTGRQLRLDMGAEMMGCIAATSGVFAYYLWLVGQFY